MILKNPSHNNNYKKPWYEPPMSFGVWELANVLDYVQNFNKHIFVETHW